MKKLPAPLNQANRVKTVPIRVLVIPKMTHRPVLANHHRRVNPKSKLRTVIPRNVIVEALAPVNPKRNRRRIKKKNHTNRAKKAPPGQNIRMSSKRRRNPSRRKGTITTTNINLEVGTTSGRTRTSIGTNPTTKSRGSVPKDLVLLVTNRGPDDGGVEIDPKRNLVGGIGDLTIGIGLTIGLETTTSTIGMNALGTTATTAIPAAADEHQVTSCAGGIFTSILIRIVSTLPLSDKMTSTNL